MVYSESLNISGHEGLTLSVKAYKHAQGTIRVRASVDKVSGMVKTHVLTGIARDYFKVLREIECKRITSKALQDALDSTLTQLDYIREKAKEHYQST